MGCPSGPAVTGGKAGGFGKRAEVYEVCSKGTPPFTKHRVNLESGLKGGATWGSVAE